MEKVNKNDAILNLLNSKESGEILKGLKLVRQKGKENHVEKIIDILEYSEDQIVCSDIELLLYDLKDEVALTPIIERLKSNSPHPKRKILLSSLWQSSLDANKELELLVSIAIEGDYLECLECLTIIENFETTPDEEAVYNSTLKLKNYLVTIKDEIAKGQDDKSVLLLELFEILKGFNEEN